MSAEAFETVLSCDIRTASYGRGVEYARAGEGSPRWLRPDGTINRDSGERPWVTCYLYAENVVDIAANAVATEVMNGETGDYPDHRAWVADVLRVGAALTRTLALDAANDTSFPDDDRWDGHVERLRALLDAAPAREGAVGVAVFGPDLLTGQEVAV